VIGAANFTNQVLLPALKKANVDLKTIASSGETSSVHAGKKFGFKRATTDIKEIMQDEDINALWAQRLTTLLLLMAKIRCCCTGGLNFYTGSFYRHLWYFCCCEV